jgi:hypothetical protein
MPLPDGGSFQPKHVSTLLISNPTHAFKTFSTTILVIIDSIVSPIIAVCGKSYEIHAAIIDY